MAQNTPPAHGSSPALVHVPEEPIASVEVEGNKTVPTDQILEVVSTKPGETADEEKLNRDVHSIYDLGFSPMSKSTPSKTKRA